VATKTTRLRIIPLFKPRERTSDLDHIFLDPVVATACTFPLGLARLDDKGSGYAVIVAAS